MTHLPNAPVRYVLGVLRFPRASDPGKLVALTQECIRDKYPISAEFAAPQIQVEVGSKWASRRGTATQILAIFFLG